eukprot:scaffold148624_cov35-Tisochrysis_lutea.AAC.3
MPWTPQWPHSSDAGVLPALAPPTQRIRLDTGEATASLAFEAHPRRAGAMRPCADGMTGPELPCEHPQ